MAEPTPAEGMYETRDLHVEGVWPLGPKPRYGGTVFDLEGRILLRRPTGDYGGYVWTFPKGRPDVDEHPTRTALRETLEETGYRPVIIGHLPGRFSAGLAATSNYFYVMEDRNGQVERAAMVRNGETADLRWATESEAEELIATTTNPNGRRRDLAILRAAYTAYRRR